MIHFYRDIVLYFVYNNNINNDIMKYIKNNKMCTQLLRLQWWCFEPTSSQSWLHRVNATINLKKFKGTAHFLYATCARVKSAHH